MSHVCCGRIVTDKPLDTYMHCSYFLNVLSLLGYVRKMCELWCSHGGGPEVGSPLLFVIDTYWSSFCCRFISVLMSV